MAARQVQIEQADDETTIFVDGVELDLHLPPHVEPQLFVDTRKRQVRIVIDAERIDVDGRRAAG